jgi:hypothetical protein
MQIGNIDVFVESITIASACNKVLHKKFMAETDTNTDCQIYLASVWTVTAPRQILRKSFSGVSTTGTYANRSVTSSARETVPSPNGRNAPCRVWSS